MVLRRQGGNLHRRMSKEIYNTLEIPTLCNLGNDVSKGAKSSNFSAGPLQSLADVELLKLNIAHLNFWPRSQKRIIQQEKGHLEITQGSTIGPNSQLTQAR